MARRATKLRELKQVENNGAPYILLAGPWEFMPQEENGKQPSEEMAPAFSKAYASMPYNAVFALPEELAWLESHGQPVPPMIAPIDDKIRAMTINAGDFTVAVVTCPLIMDEAARDGILDAVAAKAEEMDKGNDLVVGVSPWGMETEQHFLDNHPASFDILLGSGPGHSVGGIMGTNKTYWVRSYRKGKALLDIAVFDLPPKDGPDFVAKDLYKAQVIVLNQNIESDPEISMLFPAEE